MDNSLPSSLSVNHGSPIVGPCPRHSPDIPPDDPRYKPPVGTQKENRAPMSLPTTLSSMLKTTTETGDIGQFAIKPSRLPPHRKQIGIGDDYLSQRPQQASQLQNGQQAVDDRRRLPSYARDATSEIVSLYETTSQKVSNSARVLGNRDHRSYSMTHTSYSSNALSNHRSYNSLRSQPELGLLPRPRSPFLYPARPKHLGFRSSSPIPTEAVRVDSSQHTEPYIAGTSLRSASPLTTHNRRLPFPSAAQVDSNNTYSSTLGYLPSGGRSQSPFLKLTNDSMQDWNSRPAIVSTKASPAGNDFRSISTPTNCHRRSPNSFTGSTSKLHTPSPLYYDYTEDFNVEEAAAEGAATDDGPSSIPFILSNATDENRETTSEVSPKYDLSHQGPQASVNLDALVTLSTMDSLERPDDKARLNNEDSQTERSINVTQDIIPLYLDRRPYNRVAADQLDVMDSSLSTKLIDAHDRSLPSTFDAGNILSAIPVDEVNLIKHNQSNGQPAEDTESLDRGTLNEGISASDITSSFRLSKYLPNFPRPPHREVQISMNGESRDCQDIPARLPLDSISVRKTRNPTIQDSREGLGPVCHSYVTIGTSRHQLDLPTGGVKRSSTTNERRIRSSGYYWIDHGLSDLAQLISNFEFANGSFIYQDVNTQSAEATLPLAAQSTSVVPSSGPLGDSLVQSTESLPQLTSSLDFRIPMSRFRSDGDLRASSSRTFSARLEKGEAVSCCSNASFSVYQGPLPRSEPLLLAPKAFSPARVLRLKNSVPQLMKALPSVPQNSSLQSLSPSRSLPFHSTSTSRGINLEHRETSAGIEPSLLETPPFQPISSRQGSEESTDLEQTLLPRSKFGIKSRFFDAQRSHSPANSRPWNLDESYPWYGQQPTIRLSSLRSILPGTQRGPKFKLRVTRASTSPSTTIRINPEAKSSLDLQYPKDLFTSGSNLSGIFRQVSRQFSSRKSSTVLGGHPRNDTVAPLTVLASIQSNGSDRQNTDLLGPPSSPTMTYPTSPTEVRSFFSEDSSQIRGYSSLRKRISNLRARIPKPYASHPAANMNNSEVWSGQVTEYNPTESRSRANISSEEEDDYGMPVTTRRHQNLRSKVSRWFKDAGMAMKRGVKLHDSADVHCIPYR